VSDQLGNLPLSYEELRSLVIESLSRVDNGQINDLRTAIAELAVERSQAADPATHSQGGYRTQPGIIGGDGPGLTGSDYGRVQSIMWDLIIEGVIRPGLADGANNKLPFFHVTERGKHWIKEGPQSPYDPDGYLKRLRSSVAGLDPIIVTYLNESLHTFRIGCLLSSTIALGCASEKALLLLIAAYSDALPSTMQDKFRKNTEGRMIKRQFDEFRKMLDSHLRGHLTPDLADGLDITLNAVFEMIRTQRNDAGHPTGKEVSREQVYASLVVFPTYLKKVYDLIDWLKTAEF
jgi:hypothetical protein